eukprot:2755370-Ditylum_brightwellii.AAC.1
MRVLIDNGYKEYKMDQMEIGHNTPNIVEITQESATKTPPKENKDQTERIKEIEVTFQIKLEEMRNEMRAEMENTKTTMETEVTKMVQEAMTANTTMLKEKKRNKGNV